MTAFAFVSHSNAILEEQMESSDFAACTFAVYAPILTAQLLCSPSNFEASLATKVPPLCAISEQILINFLNALLRCDGTAKELLQPVD